jgi:hypothetical protein
MGQFTFVISSYKKLENQKQFSAPKRSVFGSNYWEDLVTNCLILKSA